MEKGKGEEREWKRKRHKEHYRKREKVGMKKRGKEKREETEDTDKNITLPQRTHSVLLIRKKIR